MTMTPIYFTALAIFSVAHQSVSVFFFVVHFSVLCSIVTCSIRTMCTPYTMTSFFLSLSPLLHLTFCNYTFLFYYKPYFFLFAVRCHFIPFGICVVGSCVFVCLFFSFSFRWISGWNEKSFRNCCLTRIFSACLLFMCRHWRFVRYESVWLFNLCVHEPHRSNYTLSTIAIQRGFIFCWLNAAPVSFNSANNISNLLFLSFHAMMRTAAGETITTAFVTVRFCVKHLHFRFLFFSNCLSDLRLFFFLCQIQLSHFRRTFCLIRLFTLFRSTVLLCTDWLMLELDGLLCKGSIWFLS